MEDSDKLIINEAEAIECLKSNKPTIGYVMLQESIDMAIQALEKQIPMKPMFNGNNWYRCVNGCEIHKKQFEEDWYCPNCGHKLDCGGEVYG